jgi:NRPS condensation-like uncharacterized protein/acyl carrier protein
MTDVHSGLLPLSETQQQVWLTEQLAPERSVFTEAMAVRLDGRLDPAVLATALGQVARRHDVLHSVFPIVDGMPMQRVSPELTTTVVHHDLSAVPEPHRPQALAQLARNFVDGRRNLAVDPPLRGLLVALGPDDHALVLAIHHLVADGWSARLVMTELVDRYQALLAGRRVDESPPALRYADFVAWEHALLESPLVDADTDYWRAALAGAPPLELLPGRARPAEKGMVGRIAEFELGDELATPLLDLCRRNGVTTYVAALTVFAAVAARWAGQCDIVVGTQAANRVRSELEDVVGQFANTVPIRIDVHGDPDFDTLLDRCRRSSTDAVERAHIPLRRIVEVAAPARDLSRPVLIQHLFTPRERPVRQEWLGSARMVPFQIDRRRGRLDTLTEIDIRPGVLRAFVEYDTALFDETTIAALTGDWSRCLRAWLDDPSLPLSRLPLRGAPTTTVASHGFPSADDNGSTDTAEPVPELTALVRSAWQEYLGVDVIEPDDDFFVLGGHSMVCARVVHQLRDLLGVDLPLRMLFDHPTLAEFADAVERRSPGLESALRALAAMPRGDFDRLVEVTTESDAVPVGGASDLPLTSSQLPIWLAEQRDPGLLTHTIPIVMTVRGAFDVGALRTAVAAVVAHQDGLRATFAEVDGAPVQRIAAELTLDVPLIDLTNLPQDERMARAADERTRLGRHAFDLTAGPLLAVRVIRLAHDLHHVHVVFHHLVTDEVSMTVFMAELAAAYEAEVTGRPIRLPDLPVRLADHVEWERDRLRGTELARLTGFWRRQLSRAPELELPTDRPRPARRGFNGEFLALSLPHETFEGLADRAGRVGVTPFTVFLTALVVLLHRRTGATDIVIGVPTDNRVLPGSERLIGCFLNVLPLRVDCSGGPSFDGLALRVRDALLAAYDHQSLPLAMIAQAARTPRRPDRPPLFGMTCELQLPGWLPARLAGCSLEYDFVAHGTARYDLAFHGMVSAAGVSLGLEMNTDIWDRSTGLGMLDQLAALLTYLPLRTEAAC